MDTSLAPAFVRITYDGLTGPHHSIVPVNIDPSAVSGVEPNIIPKSGTPVSAETAITGYVDIWKLMLMTGQNIGLCEIYKVDAVTGEGTFLWGFDLATTGNISGAGEAYRGVSLTWKLINGRTGRTVVLENNYPVDQEVLPPYTALSPERLLSDYMISGDSIFYGRGNAYPFAPIRLVTKSYDALRTRAGL